GNTPKEFYCPDTTIGQPNQNWVSVFSSPKRYSVIIFWSLTCGHCKKAMPLWHKLYEEKGKSLDFEVFAVCKDFDVPAWKSYIRDHNLLGWVNLNGKESNLDYNDAWDITTTPTVYVVDRQNRIVTKKIEPDYLEDFLKNWQRTYYPDEVYPR
ncbi:MAG: TlpA family protein disulfide reductase, partial [Bacteroidales bacterium]|nr:TlpA family protein disulfide reductase [Bacteroidales bacterium]